MDPLSQRIQGLFQPELHPSEESRERFLKRMEQGAVTRDESPASHVCVYFLPVDRKTKRVFMVHHKKAGIWLSPGGHIDQGEMPEDALVREIQEELGVSTSFVDPKPFFFSIVDIDNQTQPCKFHFDIWYLMETDGSNFNVDPAEFLDTRWMTVPEARMIVTDPSNLLALDRVEILFS